MMNSEEFISKHLSGAVVFDHSLSVEIANKIIDKTVEAYRENSFNDLQELVKSAGEKIKNTSWMIHELSSDNGTTVKKFAESQQISEATARKRLNESSLSAKNCDKRPYIYTLAVKQ